MTRHGKEILLIDSATSGCAGAYIDGIHRHLTPKNERVEVGVSHYFPFQYGKRIFFKYSELAAQPRYRLGRARLYVRFVELLVEAFRAPIRIRVRKANQGRLLRDLIESLGRVRVSLAGQARRPCESFFDLS